jgi:hypothetical protein
MKKVSHMYMRATFRAQEGSVIRQPSPSRGWGGDISERERHATCVSRAIATHRRRRTWCGRAALPSPWRLEEEECGARAARDVPVSRERDAPSAAHMVRLRGAALPQQRLGGRGRGGSAIGTRCACLAQSRRAVGGAHGAAARRCRPPAAAGEA